MMGGLVLGMVFLFSAGWLMLWRASRFAYQPPVARPREERAIGTVETVIFPAVDGESQEGWLYLPRTERPPIVIMAPGLAGTKEGHLESFAWRFVERGIAVLAFDYRCFGGSGGLPRHHVHPRRHKEDYEAALRYVRDQKLIDGQRVILWGSSFSGGTVLLTAAENASIAGVIAQCPYVGTPEHLQPRGWALTRFVFRAVLDTVGLFPPVYIPVYGKPSEWGFAPSIENPRRDDMRDPSASAFWRTMPHPLRGGWQNRMLARLLPDLDAFNPMESVPRIACPMLLVAAEQDDLVPVQMLERAAAAALHGTLHRFGCTHFDLYMPPWCDEVAQAEAAFAERVLATSSNERELLSDRTPPIRP